VFAQQYDGDAVAKRPSIGDFFEALVSIVPNAASMVSVMVIIIVIVLVATHHMTIEITVNGETWHAQ
jgi:hypothetical protein